MMQAQFLGCGASMGVPVIGCPCPVCTNPDPRNQRLRSSLLCRCACDEALPHPPSIRERNAQERHQETTLLIDCGPDFREQALRAHLTTLHGVLITHAHMDHIGGIDDLRAFMTEAHGPLPMLCHVSAVEDLKMRHAYMLSPKPGRLRPQLQLQVLEGEQGVVEFLGQQIRWITFDQMGTTVVGYRLGSLAYVTDISKIPDALRGFLEGVEILVLSALQRDPHAYFLSLAEAIALAEDHQIPRTLLTHLSHDIDATNQALLTSKRVEFAYDGMTLFL